MKSATQQLIDLAAALKPTGEIGDGMVARFHDLAERARVETPDTPLPVEASELKPCPFCGGAALLKKYDKQNYGADEFYVICPPCDLIRDQAWGCSTEAEAIAAWNTRLQPTPSAEVGQGGEVERRDGLDDGDDDDLEGWLNDRD